MKIKNILSKINKEKVVNTIIVLVIIALYVAVAMFLEKEKGKSLLTE